MNRFQDINNPTREDTGSMTESQLQAYDELDRDSQFTTRSQLQENPRYKNYSRIKDGNSRNYCTIFSSEDIFERMSEAYSFSASICVESGTAKNRKIKNLGRLSIK